jgi:P-type Ca2+ transporter type 2C
MSARPHGHAPNAGTAGIRPASEISPPVRASVEASDGAWHARSTEAAAKHLHVDLVRGLSSADAKARLLSDGPNALAEAQQRSALAILGHQFKSLIVALLVAAGGVALVLGEIVEAVAILVVIALNALIGFATELKAARLLAGLRKQAVTTACVRRDGEERQLSAEQLVRAT